MREIKFRVWDKQTNKWAKKLCLYLDDSKIGDVSECFHNEEEGDNYIVEQYTGLKDQEGKEIYEGDILEGFDDVKFEDGRYYCNLRGARIFTLEELCCDMDYPKPKIIGNIHENPELLK